ncbi:MAG: ABC transporter ATP-binding protein [Leptolyngbyaceae cyanobacterium bins.59]|nr:ABC transporter ATP-binding protein [Leptolyngbyaceae cyanobacterium bins.59]
MADRSQLQKLATYLRPHWRGTSLGIFALLVVNVLTVIIPLLIRNGIDELEQTFSYNRVLYYVALIITLASVTWVIRMISRILIFGTGRQVEFDLKQRIFEHLLSMEPAYFAVNTAGDLISRATSDVENIRRLLGFAVLSLANTVFAYGLTLPAMLLINLKLSLLAVSVYPLMLLLVRLFSDRLRSEQLTVQEELSGMSELIQEDMSGMGLIKIYAQEENERQAFRKLNRQLLQANLEMAKTRNLLFPILIGIASLSFLILLWQGSAAIANQSLTVGNFIALILYIEQLVFPTALLGFTITTYQRGAVSIDRIEAILSVQPMIQDPPNPVAPQTIQGKITARHLTYTYPGADQPALRDLNFTIQPGETVAIVGPIGSGKSTLANALPRLLDIQPRQLWIDEYDVTELRLRDLRAAISYVPQDSFLFSMMIQDNIRYGNPIAAPSDVEQVAKQSQIHSEVLNFPQQYETLVGERGITLSGGQRQRTALARALLIDAPILILDDALSSVDNQTATQILRNLSEGTQRQTVVFISHQLTAAAMADRILVMDEGQVVQVGTHTELLQQPGLYQTLWNQQRLEELLK